MIDRLNGVSLFVQVAEAGSFALAADRVGLSRSAVGKAIARLEARLSTRLLHRTTRSQALTESGQAYYERCRRVLAELEAAEADIDTGRAAPVGRLRVTAPVLVGRRFVAPVLLDLVRQHSGLRLEIAFTDRETDLIEDGIDLAVRVGALPDAVGLATRRLASMTMVSCAAPVYLAARGLPESPDDLPAHDLLIYGRGGRSMPWRFQEPDGSIRAMILDARIRFDDLDALAAATVSGLGIARLPVWQVAGQLDDGSLVRLFPDRPGFAIDIHALWPQSRHLPSKTRAAIDALAARLPTLMD